MHETFFGFARRSGNQFDLRSRGIPSRRAVEMTTAAVLLARVGGRVLGAPAEAIGRT